MTTLSVRRLGVRYGAQRVVHGVTLEIPSPGVTAFIGPSGCGKSTVLRCLNRMNDTIDGCVVEGEIELDGRPILGRAVDVVELRRRVGMVFQRPNPFPMSIRDNVSYGLRIAGERSRPKLGAAVERALRDAALWDEVEDRLDEPASSLSGGQQQRLCIARALAVEPEVLLLDEPTSALDPIAARAVEGLVTSLAGRLTLVIVTHNLQQARRVASGTAFFYLGELVEVGATEDLFERPRDPRTKAYVAGAFG